MEDSWTWTMGAGLTVRVEEWGRGEQWGRRWDNCNYSTMNKNIYLYILQNDHQTKSS